MRHSGNRDLQQRFTNIHEAIEFSAWEREFVPADWTALDADDELRLLYGSEEDEER